MTYRQALALGFLRAWPGHDLLAERSLLVPFFEHLEHARIAHAAYLRLCDQAEGKR